MATKGASVKFIEAALAKIERELEDTQGPRKETLQKLIARVYPLLRAQSTRQRTRQQMVCRDTGPSPLFELGCSWTRH